MKKTERNQLSILRHSLPLFLLISPRSSSSLFPQGNSLGGFGDPLYVRVNKKSSTKTQLPYDYYYSNYCKPPKFLNNAENSVYTFYYIFGFLFIVFLILFVTCALCSATSSFAVRTTTGGGELT
uniref:Uncharacterized protein n=1 Tax=Brassica campestris TaxID=3711 RepID=M4DYB1_BRACM